MMLLCLLCICMLPFGGRVLLSVTSKRVCLQPNLGFECPRLCRPTGLGVEVHICFLYVFPVWLLTAWPQPSLATQSWFVARASTAPARRSPAALIHLGPACRVKRCLFPHKHARGLLWPSSCNMLLHVFDWYLKRQPALARSCCRIVGRHH